MAPAWIGQPLYAKWTIETIWQHLIMATQQFTKVSPQRFRVEIDKVQKIARQVPPSSTTPFMRAKRFGPVALESGRDRLWYWGHVSTDSEKGFRGLFVQIFRRNGTARMFNKVGRLKQYGW